MGSRKSETCLRVGGAHALTEYDSRECAEEAALTVHFNCQREFSPYQCDRCSMWHLRPASVPSRQSCRRCAGRDGRRKLIYASDIEAEECAHHLSGLEGRELHPYPCPHGNGWHLTSR
jgi:hypothetical protein